MKKINDIIDGNKDIKYQLTCEYEKSRKDAGFKLLIDSINLNDDELMKHTSSLEESVKEKNHCKDCKGLAACQNQIFGYCFSPVLEEGKLTFSYVPCHYKKKLLEEEKVFNKVDAKGIPREIKNARMKDIYTDDENRQEVIKWIMNYIKTYKKDKMLGKGLFLHGNFGCGKTYLLAAMFNELAKEGVKSVIVYYPEYLRSLKETFSSNGNDEYKDRFNELKYAKLLLLDDLGAEATTAWGRDEILGSILQYRMQEELPTFITSNLNIKELEEHLSVTSNSKLEKVKAVRIIERVKQLTIDMEMISKNNRK